MNFYYKMIADGSFCILGYKGHDVHVIIPDDMNFTVLSDNIFKGRTEIESVSIPESVTQIGGFVFDGCKGLKSIKLPPYLQDMWQYAFTRTSIEEIEIPGTVNKIIPFTFNDSKSLKKVVLNEGTTELCAWAFKGCSTLEEVYLPSTLKIISDKAFEGCGEIEFYRT